MSHRLAKTAIPYIGLRKTLGRLASREDIVAAHAEGTVRRLRPKVMTITTMAAALFPLLWAEGAGAEIMKRIAAPMVGGLATSAFLTLEVLPVLYTIWRHRQLRRARRLGVPLETIGGAVPGWARRSPKTSSFEQNDRLTVTSARSRRCRRA